MTRPNKHAARFGRWTRLGMTTRVMIMPTTEEADHLRRIARDVGIDILHLATLLHNRPGFIWALPSEWPPPGPIPPHLAA